MEAQKKFSCISRVNLTKKTKEECWGKVYHLGAINFERELDNDNEEGPEQIHMLGDEDQDQVTLHIIT